MNKYTYTQWKQQPFLFTSYSYSLFFPKPRKYFKSNPLYLKESPHNTTKYKTIFIPTLKIKKIITDPEKD